MLELHIHHVMFFFFNDTATTEIYTLSLHDALPISPRRQDHGLWEVQVRAGEGGARRQEKAARDSPEGSEIPPRDRRSRFRLQDPARARILGGRQQSEGDDDVPRPADGAHRAWPGSAGPRRAGAEGHRENRTRAETRGPQHVHGPRTEMS